MSFGALCGIFHAFPCISMHFYAFLVYFLGISLLTVVFSRVFDCDFRMPLSLVDSGPKILSAALDEQLLKE